MRCCRLSLTILTMGIAICIAQPIVDGRIYREAGSPDIFLIQNQRKIRIPTPEALVNMGFALASVQVVANGALAPFVGFDIPSSSATPGSLVFPPDGGKLIPLTGIAGSVSITSQGKNIQIRELRGWLATVPDDGCNLDDPHEAGADAHYELELDTDWAKAEGIDLHKVLRVGNIAHVGQRLAGSARSALARPTVHVELNSWGWGSESLSPPGKIRPPDWTHVQSNCPNQVPWPFDPMQPDRTKPRLSVGDYVRMSGSLLTDDPHDVQTRPGTFFCSVLSICSNDEYEWESSVPNWRLYPNMPNNDPNHPARWTEMHPPDLIQALDPKERRATVRGVALAAKVGSFPFVSNCEQREFDLAPEATRPPDSVVGFEELRGPEVFFPLGQNADNGSWVSDLGDYIHVKARICGEGLFGRPGRFKAIYRVWWKPAPTPPPPPPLPTPREMCLAGCESGLNSCMREAHSGTARGVCVSLGTGCRNRCPR